MIQFLFCVLMGASDPATMIRMNVRLMGPNIRPRSNAALPKLIYRAGPKYARLEDVPQKITIIAEPDAYSIDMMNHTGTHAIDQGGPNDLHLPMVLPFDPNHKLGILDHLEFGAELDFFTKAGAAKSAGPIINAKPTDLYTLDNGAKLVAQAGSDVPIFVSWSGSDGTYKYEYSNYEEVPFDAKLFARPSGIKFREMPPLSPDEEK